MQYSVTVFQRGGQAMGLVRSSSSWGHQQISLFLRDVVIPVRLACLHTDGFPLVCSLWYLYDDGAIWCATQRSARLIKYLESEPRCGFEVAADPMPYRGVRGQGTANLSAADGPATILRLIDRYIGNRDSDFASWLVARSASEVAIKITPDWLTSWDFSDRMKH